jgi:predicted enzyme related to lactoylglutathione lyase
MLSERKVAAALSASDINRARKFYSEKLGLEPTHDSPEGLWYECGGGTGFFVYPSQFAGTNKATAMSFETDDLEAEVAGLKSRGVVFEEYDLPEIKTVDGIATLGDEKAAWFKDSEGNIIAVSKMSMKI